MKERNFILGLMLLVFSASLHAKEIHLTCKLDKKDWRADIAIDPDAIKASKATGGYVDSNYELQKTQTEYRLVGPNDEMRINRSNLNFTYGFKLMGMLMEDTGKCELIQLNNLI